MAPTSLKALVKDYCANCTMDGVHFIADSTKQWTERWLWFVLVALCWYGSGLLTISAWEAFVEHPISFGVETIYTDWDTKMPSVAVCEASNNNKLYSVCDTIWPPGHLPDLEGALNEIVYYQGVSYNLVEFCHKLKPDPLCPISNYSYYVNLVRSNCTEIMQNCSYNGKEFDCCEYFQLIDTDIGPCYIINSIQTIKPNPYPMVINKMNKEAVLRFDLHVLSTVYTLSEDEVPTITTPRLSKMKIKSGNQHQRRVVVKNIENDPLIVDNTLEQRACRFRTENDGGLYPYYSYSSCTVKCRKKAQMDMCGCYDHFMVNTTESELCNITGMACLHSHMSHLKVLKPPWANREGMSCDCLPSCDESEISVIKDVTIAPPRKQKKKTTRIEILLAYLPSERFKRNVIRSRLDLVVSIGGTTGLFVGASLLSFVELVFYLTVRFTNNIMMERAKKRKVRAIKYKPKIMRYDFEVSKYDVDNYRF